MDAVERFRAKVAEAGDCWVWVAAKNKDGYGRFWSGTAMTWAHRWSYEHFVGPILEGLELDHTCRNTSCVNPAHLEPVTHAENVARGTSAPAVNARKVECKHGHRLVGRNLYVDPKGHRYCRSCASIRHKAFRDRKAMAS